MGLQTKVSGSWGYKLFMGSRIAHMIAFRLCYKWDGEWVDANTLIVDMLDDFRNGRNHHARFMVQRQLLALAQRGLVEVSESIINNRAYEKCLEDVSKDRRRNPDKCKAEAGYVKLYRATRGLCEGFHQHLRSLGIASREPA